MRVEGFARGCLLALAACGQHPVNDPDARNDDDGPRPDSGPCWPMDTSTPRGSVEIGTADGGFVPMPDEINLVYGTQGGFHIPASGRIHGLDPGNPNNILSPGNPRSRFRSFFVDTGEPNGPLACPLRQGYVPSGTDAYILPSVIEIRFDTALGPAELFDKQFRVQVEVMDSSGGYAIDSKVVTARAPMGWGSGAGAP